MYIDLHTHSKLTRSVEFDLKHFEKFIRTARKRGLTALALTEHFDVSNFKEIYQKINEKYEYKNDYFDVNGFKVFTGIEIDVQGNANILVIGNLNSIYELRDMFPDNITEENFMTINELTQIAREKNMLIIGAHPFRPKNLLHTYDNLYVRGLDAVELNGSDIKMKKEMYEYAEDLNMPLTAGSDSHTVFQLGTVRNYIEKDCNTVEELREEIINNRFEIKISKIAKLRNAISKKYKKYMKKRMKKRKEANK